MEQLELARSTLYDCSDKHKNELIWDDKYLLKIIIVKHDKLTLIMPAILSLLWDKDAACVREAS